MFNQVIGQQEVINKLLDEVRNNRIPHAILLQGPSGSGKMALALALAQYMLCQNPSEHDACGTCHSCRMFNNYAHPDLHFVFPIIKYKDSKNSICDNFIGKWRERLKQGAYFDFNDWLNDMEANNQQAIIYSAESEQIQKKLNLTSAMGGKKIMIIWMPEKMNQECANKLLKIIEEPPQQTHFIMVSNEADKILPTILSRTQCIDVKQINTDEIKNALIQKLGMDPELALAYARSSQGNYTKALKNASHNDELELFFDLFVMLMRLSYMRNIKELKKWSEEIADLGRERQKNFLQYCQYLIRENFIYNFHLSELNYMTPKENEFSVKFARFINERNVIKIMDELSLAQRDIEQNTNPKIVFFDFALQMIVLLIQ